MLRILDRKLIQTGSSTSRIKFEVDAGPVGIGNRYLTLDDKRAYLLGNNCQTCSFLFERLDGAIRSVEVEHTTEGLKAGVASLSDPLVEKIGTGLPFNEYVACLAEADLKIVRPGQEHDYFLKEQIDLWGEDTFWSLPDNPHVPYYRAGDTRLGKEAWLFNFVVPMFPNNWLKETTLASFTKQIIEGEYPTAVALSILDVKGPADWEGEKDTTEHWLFTHYLIDGHHKVAAAHAAGKSIRVLSYLALSQGVSSREQVETVLSFLARH
jgi:hypothetical protein